MFQGADDTLAYVKDNDIESVDIRFCDLPGVMQHFTIPAAALTQAVFEDGLAFDGSSIRGFQKIHESDMALMPDPTSAYVDPFRKSKTLVLNFFVHDPITKEAYSRDPRNIARKAEAYLASSGIGDTAFFAPEAEFYIFDSVRFETKQNASYYYIDSEAGAWNTGAETDPDGRPNRGYKVKYKGGYFPVAPVDHFTDLRDDMVRNLAGVGLEIERAHHEVGTAGQAEINYKFNTMLAAADDVMKFKYVVKNTAWAAGKTVTFMPKPIFGDNGSGMHVHQSLWKEGVPLFADEAGYAGLRTWRATTSVACSTTRRACWRSRTRRRTRTTVSSRASRLRSTSCTRAVTAPHVSVSRSPARTRRPSASSSAARIPARTRTSPSPPASWPASTASSTRSSRWPRSTRTCTSCLPRSTH